VSGRFYEEERLMLHVQEAIAEAHARSGMSKAAIAARAGYSHRAVVTHAMAGDSLTLRTVARLLAAMGYRLAVSIEPIPATDEGPAPRRTAP
jgi:hypothetical protein